VNFHARNFSRENSSLGTSVALWVASGLAENAGRQTRRLLRPGIQHLGQIIDRACREGVIGPCFPPGGFLVVAANVACGVGIGMTAVPLDQTLREIRARKFSEPAVWAGISDLVDDAHRAAEERHADAAACAERLTLALFSIVEPLAIAELRRLLLDQGAERAWGVPALMAVAGIRRRQAGGCALYANLPFEQTETTRH
jgi:hypothetical protein